MQSTLALGGPMVKLVAVRTSEKIITITEIEKTLAGLEYDKDLLPNYASQSLSCFDAITTHKIFTREEVIRKHFTQKRKLFLRRNPSHHHLSHDAQQEIMRIACAIINRRNGNQNSDPMTIDVHSFLYANNIHAKDAIEVHAKQLEPCEGLSRTLVQISKKGTNQIIAYATFIE